MLAHLQQPLRVEDLATLPIPLVKRLYLASIYAYNHTIP